MPGESSITDEKNDSALKQLDNQLQEVRSKLSRSTQENQHLRDQIAQLKKEHKYALNTQREDSDRNILVLEDEKEELNAKNCEMSAELDELRSKNEELQKIIKKPISEDVELHSATNWAGSVSGTGRVKTSKRRRMKSRRYRCFARYIPGISKLDIEDAILREMGGNVFARVMTREHDKTKAWIIETTDSRLIEGLMRAGTFQCKSQKINCGGKIMSINPDAGDFKPKFCLKCDPRKNIFISEVQWSGERGHVQTHRGESYVEGVDYINTPILDISE
eukprot:186073_1